MKNLYITIAVNIILLIFSNLSVNAQHIGLMQSDAFQAGSLLVSVSEGHTASVFTTRNMTPNSESPAKAERSEVIGCRDPFFIEFGITNHWGIGLSSGTDIYELDPSKLYGFNRTDNKPITVSTSDFTFTSSYHFVSNKRLDLSVFIDVGGFNVKFKQKDEDSQAYQYTSNGNLMRIGGRVRYYFFHHFGVFGMVSSYAGHTSPKKVTDNTIAGNYTTNVSGCAVEAGLCYRFFR